MIRPVTLDGIPYARAGMLLLPIDLTDDELERLLSDSEPMLSPARDTRPLAHAEEP